MTNSLPPPSAEVHRGRLWLIALGLSLLVSLAILLPFFWLGSASGHDFEFHAASWLDVAEQWKQHGELFPRWTAWANHGFGEPRYIFYPPLSWLLGAALCLLVPGPWVPAVFILIVQTFAGLSAFSLLRRLVHSRAALIGAACYVMNPNALLIIYLRSDFAEQLACAFFPLMFLAALRLCNLLEDRSSHLPSIVWFAVPFALVWLSNAPAGVIASYAMAFLFAWAALTLRSGTTLLRGACALALGFGLVGFYLLPAAYEQRWVNISQALSSGLLPVQNFLFSRIDDVEHTWFNWIASTCALLLILFFALAAVGSRQFASSSSQSFSSRKTWAALLALGSAASLLMFRATLPLWIYLPKLRFVQFPWRWMSIVALIFSCFLAADLQKRRGWAWVFLFLLITPVLAYFLVNNSWWDPDEMPTLQAAITTGAGFDGTDEYDPAGDDHLDLPLNAPIAKILPANSGAQELPNSTIQIQKWHASDKYLRVQTPTEARLALRLLNYPAWRVELNGKQITPERMDDINQMVIPLDSGTSLIHIYFRRTPDRTAGYFLSLISVLLAAILWRMGRARSPLHS
jgi:hypothetical protein